MIPIKINSINTSAMVATSCEICNDEKSLEIYPQKLDSFKSAIYSFSARRKRELSHYRIVKCCNCGLLRANPIFSVEYLKSLYSDSLFLYSNESKYANDTYFELFLSLSLEKRSNKSIRILDIGCGNGGFLERLCEAGYRNISGIEPSRDAYNNAKTILRDNIINKTFDASDFDNNSFDIICNFHLLDHLSSPLIFLQQCRNILDKDGYLLTACHDVSAFSVKVFGEWSPVYDIEHIYLFNMLTLQKLMEKAGFEVLHLSRYTNTYPLGYWLRLIPFINKIEAVLPAPIKKIPVRLSAGNIYTVCKIRKGTN
jgi:2-polyprenyl-3-methyl-5-hydroxy-6-metoxy-1,4-benzoquinol methylase